MGLTGGAAITASETILEQLQIALHNPRCYVYKMYSKDRPRRFQDPNQQYSGIRGNATSFQLNAKEIADMVDGRMFPRSTSILPSLVSVAFVGSGKLPKSWLRSTFRVRRQRVRDALHWLKENRPRYSHITITDGRLHALPEDDDLARQPMDDTDSANEAESDWDPTEEADGGNRTSDIDGKGGLREGGDVDAMDEGAELSGEDRAMLEEIIL